MADLEQQLSQAVNGAGAAQGQSPASPASDASTPTSGVVAATPGQSAGHLASSPQQGVDATTGRTTSSTAESPSTDQIGSSRQSAASVLDAIRRVDPALAAQFQDDQGALQHLILAQRQAAQLQPLANLGQQYLPHHAEFREFLNQKQEQARKEQAAKQAWFKAPEYDPAWINYVERDPQTNQLRVKPGYPPDILTKLQAARDHSNSFLDKFAFDPIGAIKPGLEEIVRQVAQEQIQQNLGSFQERQQANTFLEKNASWMNARDAQGNVQINPQTGLPRLSPWGQRFSQYVEEANQMGLADSGRQIQYATRMLERDVAMSSLQGPQANQQQQQANQQFVQAQNRPNVPNQIAQANEQANRPSSLRERLQQAFEAQGIK